MKPYVDYTLLKPDAMFCEFALLCKVARNWPKIIRTVCVLPDPEVIDFCSWFLKGTGIKVCAVNDFPLGRGGARLKAIQAEIAKRAGAKEIDTVINICAFQGGNDELVLEELRAVTSIFPKRTKVIIETGHEFYTEKLIKKATELVAKSGAFCVKTSTGFVKNIPVGEKIKHVQWMHEVVPELMKKVAGGIRSKTEAQLFFDILPKDKLIFGASSKFWL